MPGIFIFSGPSAAGKTTIVRTLEFLYPQYFKEAVSDTTRPMRPGEKDGRDYYFIDKATFLQRLGRGEYLEHQEVYGNIYGLRKREIIDILNSGKNALVIVYPEAMYFFDIFKDQYPVITIFVDADNKILVKRLMERQVSKKDIEKRLQTIDYEREFKEKFDIILDTSHTTPEQTVDYLLDKLRQFNISKLVLPNLSTIIPRKDMYMRK